MDHPQNKSYLNTLDRFVNHRKNILGWNGPIDTIREKTSACNYMLGSQISTVTGMWLDSVDIIDDFWYFYHNNFEMHNRWCVSFINNRLEGFDRIDQQMLASIYAMVGQMGLFRKQSYLPSGRAVMISVMGITTAQKFLDAATWTPAFDWNISLNAEFIHPSVMSRCLEITGLHGIVGTPDSPLAVPVERMLRLFASMLKDGDGATSDPLT